MNDEGVFAMGFMRVLPVILAAALAAGLAGCQTQTRGTVFYINSYHEGYASSDDVTAGIEETLEPANVGLEVFFMDSKRRPEPAAILARSQEAMQRIGEIQPDVIIASDDNAVQSIVAEYFTDGPIPCVFCGVNWTCEQYGLPTENVTGMLEVLPVRETVQTLMEYYPDARRLIVLSEDTTSERKNQAVLAPIFAEYGLKTQYVLVDTFNDWRVEFLKASVQSDLIFLPTNGAIRGWNDRKARSFVAGHIRVPVFTCDDFMMPYAAFGMTKVAREQGRWAANAALKILNGTSPGDIPVARNEQTIAYINTDLARKVGFQPSDSLLRRCRKVR
jgi:ABC-type uncharacterized transport system substrate-binding protein